MFQIKTQPLRHRSYTVLCSYNLRNNFHWNVNFKILLILNYNLCDDSLLQLNFQDENLLIICEFDIQSS